jgi:hypothetical protein
MLVAFGPLIVSTVPNVPPNTVMMSYDTAMRRNGDGARRSEWQPTTAWRTYFMTRAGSHSDSAGMKVTSINTANITP